jgi:hypothetical protein
MIRSFHLVNISDMKLSVEQNPAVKIAGSATRAPCLLPVHQLPPKPAYLLVKIWRPLEAASEIEQQLVRLRRRVVEIGPIDFFSATGRLTGEGLLTELEARLAETSRAKRRVKLP